MCIVFLLILTGCNYKEDLELEIITPQIRSLKMKFGDGSYYESLSSDDSLGVNPKAKTIVTYRLTNNSDETYYFNQVVPKNIPIENLIRIDKAFLRITDDRESVRVSHSSPTPGPGAKIPRNLAVADALDHHFLNMNSNFIIHPKETLYFEWFIVLPYGHMIENEPQFVQLDSNKKYLAALYLSSSNVDYKNKISMADLKTVEKNGYKVYDGVIKSKNKVPVVFVNTLD